MILNVLFLLNCFVYAPDRQAFAARPPAKRTDACEKRLLITVKEPPDPLTIDPENENEILDYINTVTIKPNSEIPFSLRDAFQRIWADHTDLSPSKIDERVRPYNKSRYALKRLRSTGPARRGELGRLRLVWLNLIRDIAPDQVIPHERSVRHRAEALLLLQNPGLIEQFLSKELGIPVPHSPEAVAEALNQCGEIHSITNFTLRARATPAADKARKAEIVRLWKEYLTFVTAHESVKITVPNVGPMIFRHRDEMPADPRDVPRDERWILEYVKLRYPLIPSTDQDALDQFVRQLRADHDLPAEPLTFSTGAFKKILWGSNQKETKLLFEVWDNLIQDIATKE